MTRHIQGEEMLMRARVVISAAFFTAVVATPAHAGTFADSHDQVPPTWTGTVFRLSQQFPSADPSKATPAPTYPWQQHDFRTQPALYIKAVYDYVQEGNREVDWAIQDNAVRRWYHAPWMHYGDKGREYVRGLTRERTTPAPSQPGKGELGPLQTTCFQNWAVGFLNAPGGYVFGQVWANPNAPDPLKALFPEGTVAAKLLFTTASVDQAPYLKDTLEWDANIDTLFAGDPKCRFTGGRQVQKVRLLQMDLAVRDRRADDTTGWVFATYSYDGSRGGAGWWDRMVPVGVMWGNDPKLDQAAFDGGARVKESWINPDSRTPQHLGFLGRLNGPVDNPISACLSCHMTAEVPARSSMTPPPPNNPKLMRWFENMPAGNSFDQRAIGTDYNLQISNGIQNFQLWKQTTEGGFVAPPQQQAGAASPQARMSIVPAVAPPAETSEILTINGEQVYKVDR
jgi:hypothetical protein